MKCIAHLLSLAALVAARPAFAAGKPLVNVQFKVEASAYRDHFGPGVGGVDRVENDVTSLLVTALRRHVGFADFAPASSSGGAYTLFVTLGVPAPGAPVATQKVLLYAALSASGVAPPPRVSWRSWIKYREAASACDDIDNDAGCHWPDAPQFITEITALLVRDSSYEDLVKNVLSAVSIADSGKFVIQPAAGWLLPFRQQEMCLNTMSKLLIKNDIRISDTMPNPVPGAFYAQLIGPSQQDSPDPVFSLFLNGENDAEKAKEPLLRQFADKTVVRGVYVVEYQRFEDGCGPVAPVTAPPAAPGGML